MRRQRKSVITSVRCRSGWQGGDAWHSSTFPFAGTIYLPIIVTLYVVRNWHHALHWLCFPGSSVGPLLKKNSFLLSPFSYFFPPTASPPPSHHPRLNLSLIYLLSAFQSIPASSSPSTSSYPVSHSALLLVEKGHLMRQAASPLSRDKSLE